MKTYKQSLEKGVRPEFVFPISVTVGEDKIEVNSKEALKKLFHKGGKGEVPKKENTSVVSWCTLYP